MASVTRARQANAEAAQRKLAETERQFLLFREASIRERDAQKKRLDEMDKEAVYLRDMVAQGLRFAQVPSSAGASTSGEPVASGSGTSG